MKNVYNVHIFDNVYARIPYSEYKRLTVLANLYDRVIKINTRIENKVKLVFLTII